MIRVRDEAIKRIKKVSLKNKNKRVDKILQVLILRFEEVIVMKQLSRSIGIAVLTMFLVSIVVQTCLAESIYGRAIMNISTRSGPSTRYQETGTYELKGQWLEILARAYDEENEIWWVKVVIPSNGRALWTGYKRFDYATLPLNSIPIEGGQIPQYNRPNNKGRNSNDEIYGLAIMKISTRSGPSTKYPETGTYDLAGQYLRVLARAYDEENEIWWIKCVIPSNGHALWTGYKRFEHSTLPLESIPIEHW